MADVLIRGMKMPKDGYVEILMKIADGEICYNYVGENKIYFADFLPLPEGHGRLIDAREVLEKADKASWFDGDVSELGLLLGSEVTTIIPAEGGKEDG